MIGRWNPFRNLLSRTLSFVPLSDFTRRDRVPPTVRFARNCLTMTVSIWMTAIFAMAIAGAVIAPQAVAIVAALGIVAAVAGQKARFSGSGWVFGTARLADRADLLHAGCIGSTGGFLVGRIPAPRLREAIGHLWRLPRHLSLAACITFFAALRREPQWVRLVSGVHTLIISPPGGGKTTGLVLPVLLTNKDSAVVLDVKGEICRATAEARRAMGHQIVVLDPFHVVTNRPDTFNPLSVIDPMAPNALDDIRALAEVNVDRSGERNTRHFDDGAVTVMTTTAAWAVLKAPPAHRNLQSVATIIADPTEQAEMIRRAKDENAWQGTLARLAHTLDYFVDRERASVYSTACRHLQYLNTPAVAASTRASSFDPARLKAGKMTVYLVIPPQYLRSHAALLRLWITSLVQAVIRGGATEAAPVQFILDEAAALGEMPAVTDGIAQLRGYGARFTLVYQALGQLKKSYPDGQDETVLSQMDRQVFLGLNDLQTAEYVSKRIGTASVENWSASGSDAAGTSVDAHGKPTHSNTRTNGWSASETAREVFKPEEVLAAGPRTAFVFAPGIPPLTTTLVRHYEPAFRTVRATAARFANLKLAARAFGLLALTLGGLAVAVAASLPKPGTRHEPSPVSFPVKEVRSHE